MRIEDFTLKREEDNVPWRLFTPEQSNTEYCVLWPAEAWFKKQKERKQIG